MATVSTSQNLNTVTRTAGEDITITSGAKLTIDAQVPADVASLATNLGSVICITSGEFEVLNNSTTDPIVITVSANTKDLRFEKNGKIKTRGASIQLGVATGSASETFSFASAPLNTIPYPSLVEVETSAGSDDYLPYWIVPVAGYTVNWSTTEFAGNDYAVGRVLFWNLTTRTLTAGDGTNGNLLPTGAKLRIPNIYICSASTNATPSSRSQIDLNPSGSLDMEWTAFCEKWYLSTSTFTQIRMIHCGWGTVFEATSSNGSVELDHFSVIPDTEQILNNTDFDINQILGHCRLNKISAIVAGLPTGATRIRFGQLFDLESPVADINVARRDGITSSTDEAMIIQNVPAGTDFRRLYISGGRAELTNIADVRFIDCGVARSTGTIQLSTANTQAWSLTNCTKLKFVSGGMAGPSVCRNQWLSVDSQSSEIQAFNLTFDCGDQAQGLVTSAGAVAEFYNCSFPNIRTTGTNVDSPTTFLSSFTNVRNCKGSGLGTIVLEATQSGIYDIVCGTPNDFSTTFNGATTFAFANLVDKGLSATTGNVVVGPFGAHTELTFTGTAQLDQAGSIELFEINDAFEVESYFDMHAITSFQNASTIFTYTEASTVNTDTTTAPTGISFEFRVRNPDDAYGAYQALTPANLAGAISALTGYDNEVGLRMQIKGTATVQDTTRLITQIIMPTNINTNWVAPDAYLTIRGAEATDITTMYRFSDDAVIDTFTGAGLFTFLASPYFEQSAYFIRRNSDGFEIMRTRSSPQTVILGDNGFVDLFAGAQVQLAQSADVSAIKSIVEAYLDVTISSRLASASYIAPDNASVTAIKTKTDLMSFSAGNILADMVAISGDSVASDNLEAMFDGTGYTDDQAPAKQSQVGALASVGSAVNTPALSYVLTTGVQSANTVSSTIALDGVKHEHTDTAGTIDLYYEFNIGSAIASSVQVTGAVTGNNDNLQVHGYNWQTSQWVQIGNLVGTASSTNQVHNYNLFTSMVGDGVNKGKVRIRFSGTGLTSATLYIDQIFVAFSASTEGYELASVWYDSNTTNTGTQVGVDGTSRNPVSTESAMLTIMNATNLRNMQLASGSSLTLTQAHNDHLLYGHGASIDLNGQDVDGCHFFDMHVTGAGISANEVEFHDCEFDMVSVQNAHIYDSTIESTLYLTETGDYRLHHCESGVAGSGSPIIEKTLGKTVTIQIRKWSGGLTFNNLQAGDVITIGGELGTITLNGTAGIVEIRGTYKAIVNNLTDGTGVNTTGAIRCDYIDAPLSKTDTKTNVKPSISL